MFHCVFLLAPNACLCRHFKVYVSGISSVLRVQHQGPSINYVVSKSELFEPPSPLFFIMQGLFSKSSLGLLPTETTQFMDDSTLNRVYRVQGVKIVGRHLWTFSQIWPHFSQPLLYPTEFVCMVRLSNFYHSIVMSPLFIHGLMCLCKEDNTVTCPHYTKIAI